MTSSFSFGVNGRFLTQRATGVQRYARNVIGAMNETLAERGVTAPIIAPSEAIDPGFLAMPLVPAGTLHGHSWEQFVLPFYWRERLLNLCNTAPAVKADQVVCIHDANVFVAPEAYGRSFRAFYGTLQPLLARRAARISTVSTFSARQIVRYLQVRAADIAILPNGHEHALSWNPSLSGLGASVFGASHGQPDRPFVLAVGSRARHKNLKLLLEAAPDLAAMGIDVIVAGGDNAIFAAEALQSAPNVKAINYVTDHDLAYLMDRALCLTFPSWTEGFGLPILEAMARGCPVISSDRASMPEVCGDAALMAPPDDPAVWVRNVRALLKSADLRQDLVGRGRERARLFSWAESAAGYLDLMYQPAARRPYRPKDDRSPQLSVAAVIATVGRPEVVNVTVRHFLEHQKLRPSVTIVSCVSRADAGDLAHLPGVVVITGRAGLAAQRNAALDALPAGIDVVAFFDDDFVADPDWLATAVRTFEERPEVAGFTGNVLADGIKGPGLPFGEAVRLLEESKATWSFVEPYSPYGCNMAFRMSAIGALRFDERLVLYGWLEDRDFGASLARRGGRLVKGLGAQGVHLGVKSGRIAGNRLGYSQVINPIYMLRKGTMNLRQVADHLFRNVASNVVRSARPEPFIDRRGRLRGNLRAMTDVLRGRIEPERATDIKPESKG